ncbi:cystathionine beta-lyase [Metabacillus idriensis]|uniref:cystathionine beta-lyase n=1 Tax=Bacillaceae TaxID=186817 RepID=UPI0008A9C725|nr:MULTISPECIES: cystathionine beta-lyase [Bacillaceae]MCM3595168.1 cystathionine beta-lyase [Metabacillus idriensis]MDR0136523.1 cystathionine beta-lyase [Metabacillus idriensis]OHR74346.1 cystathionine gamma-synthase [Bacillus sp. HMSC76G11]TDL80582.1 cystathionine beta-lyase MetC [Peribacillus frigoritolerans]
MSNGDWKFETKLLHNRQKVQKETGAVSVPIHHSSTFHQFDFDDYGKFDYSRSGNPTREALEETIAELEGGTKGFAFASGMAAISTCFLLLSKGDHVLITEDVYGGTYRIITDVLSRFGIEYSFVDMTDLHEVASHIKPNTKVIYVETPSNPLLKITDIQGITKLAKANNCLTFLDNTFLTPVLQRPLELGVDIVLHSATKFLAGHSDVLAGLAVVKDAELAAQVGKLQNAFGAVLGVQDSWLVLRGIKTLNVRLQQSSASARKLAEYLSKHKAVRHVYYPGLTFHPGHSIQRYQADGPGAVLSFTLADEDAVRTLVKNVELPVFAVSLGAVESILSYPARMSHAAMPKEERERRGITDGLLRISVGLEDADDLIKDFEQALAKLPAHAHNKLRA